MESAGGIEVRVTRGRMAWTGGIAVASLLALSPALAAAVGAIAPQGDARRVSLDMIGSIGSFTPVTSDDRLARAYARAARESQSRGFRFTPTAGSMNGNRSLTILVRAPGNGALAAAGTTERVLPNLGVAPVAYNLGATRGLARFTASDAGARLAPAQEAPVIEHAIAEPGTRFALQPKRDRFSANLQLANREQTMAPPTADAPQTLGTEQSYSVDVSSSYSLTRNLDLQAGLRFKGPSNRLAPTVTDQAQDSQAIYVGTTFKF